jgi:hypothetical protein
LLGVDSPKITPQDIALEAYLAMSPEERKAFIQEMSGLASNVSRARKFHLSNADYSKLQAMISSVMNEVIALHNDLGAGQIAITKTIEALVPARDPSKSLMVMFLALPSHQQKSFLLEASVRMNSWQT